MRLLIQIITVLLFFSCNKNEIPKPDESGLYIKFFGGAFEENGFSVIESGDGGYILAGSTVRANRPDTNILVVKVNSNGNKVWEKVYELEDEYDEVARDLVLSSSGDVIVAGYKENKYGFTDILLLQINNNDPAEFKTYVFGDTLTDEKAFNVIIDNDGAFITYGLKVSADNVNSLADMYLLKTNLTDTVWVRQIGVTDKEDEIGHLELTENDNLVWSGTSHRNDGTDMRMVMSDGFGNLIFDFGFQDNDGINQYGYDIKSMNDGYVICGSRDRTNSTSRDIYLVRTDKDGIQPDLFESDIVVSPTASQEAYSLVVDEAGNYIVAGYATSELGDKEIYVAKISQNGSVIVSNLFGGAGDDMGKKIIKTTGGYLIVGTVMTGNNTMVGLYKVNDELQLIP